MSPSTDSRNAVPAASNFQGPMRKELRVVAIYLIDWRGALSDLRPKFGLCCV